MRDAGKSWRQEIDARLVFTVQAVAGARCHAPASLLQQYYYAAYACARRLSIDFEAARKELQDVEAALRRFVFECRRPELAPHAESLADRVADEGGHPAKWETSHVLENTSRTGTLPRAWRDVREALGPRRFPRPLRSQLAGYGCSPTCSAGWMPVGAPGPRPVPRAQAIARP